MTDAPEKLAYNVREAAQALGVCVDVVAAVDRPSLPKLIVIRREGALSGMARLRGRTEPLYLDEGAIADRLGLSALEWQTIAQALEKRGLPQRDPLFLNRRYWPAVQAYLDRRAGIGQTPVPATTDGEEDWDANRRLARPRPASLAAADRSRR